VNQFMMLRTAPFKGPIKLWNNGRKAQIPSSPGSCKLPPSVGWVVRSRAATLLVTVGLSAAASSAAPPKVTQVEPPNWWAGHSHNPVRLLISGENLSGARIEAPAGFEAGPTRQDEQGRHLFVSLRIPTNTQPGEVLLRVAGEAGESRLAFPLLAPPRQVRAQGLSADDVIYLLLPDRFANGDPSNDDPPISPGLHDRSRPRRYHGGDFQGILDRLGYLKDLGVTALWLTPWYDNINHLNEIQSFFLDTVKNSPIREPSADYHGYGVVDFYAVEEHFGDMALLQRLVDGAHASGMKVMQDQVVNSTSPYHPWVTNPPTPTWFNGTLADHLVNSFQTWTITVSNPPPDQLKATLEGWFFGLLPDLNQNDPEVGEYLIQNSLWWLGMTGVDAVRQDALPYVPRGFWARWAAATKQEYPALTIVGEMWDGDPKKVAFFQGGVKRFDGVDSGVDTLFDFPLHYAMRDVFARGEPMTRLTEALAGDACYPAPTKLVTFLGLHDQRRFLSEPGATPDGLKLAFTFLLSTRGTPLIYYGDEVGMRGEEDPHNRSDFPGGWREDGHNAFDPAGRTPEEAAIHAHVRKLLHLRKELPALQRGKLLNLSVSRDTYVFARVLPGNCAIVAFNNSVQRQRLDFPITGLFPRATPAVADRLGGLGTVKIAEDKLRFVLPPRTAALLTP
jgi:glycosidase